MRRNIDVLLVEDDDADARIIDIVSCMVKGFHIELTRVNSLENAKLALDARNFDICLLDFWLGQKSSLRFLATLEQMDSLIGTVVLSNISPEEAASLRLSSCGSHFLPKADCTPLRLENAISSVISNRVYFEDSAALHEPI